MKLQQNIDKISQIINPNDQIKNYLVMEIKMY